MKTQYILGHRDEDNVVVLDLADATITKTTLQNVRQIEKTGVPIWGISNGVITVPDYIRNLLVDMLMGYDITDFADPRISTVLEASSEWRVMNFEEERWDILLNNIFKVNYDYPVNDLFTLAEQLITVFTHATMSQMLLFTLYKESCGGRVEVNYTSDKEVDAYVYEGGDCMHYRVAVFGSGMERRIIAGLK